MKTTSEFSSSISQNLPAAQSVASNGPRPLLLRKKEVALLLQVSPRMLDELTHSGLIPCVRLGRSVRYQPDSVKRAIQALETATGTLN